MDWAGIAVERATQTKLDDYMQEHIFEPSGINDMSFLPSKDMKARLAGFWQRDADDRLSPRQYPLSKPLVPDQASDMFQSGGAGLWGTAREYSSNAPSQLVLMENHCPNRVDRASEGPVKQRDLSPYWQNHPPARHDRNDV